MPGFDRTGPQGQGPRTGGGRGFCAGGAAREAGLTAPAFGGGFGRGGGRGFGGGRGGRGGGGRGWRNQFRATGLPGWMRFGGAPAATEKEDLEQRAAALREQLALIEEQLKQKA
ncbi:MAG: DUF5320 domain-containing protein [Planctomycetes bacterium]|jgi:hypothetical protein|nr:DUF5320 domain-containing protein [Planctomycetota bacterium]